jgi:hypothetical protein
VPSGLVRHHKTKFETEIQERGIKVLKAPAGLSRHKQNKSQWAGKKGVMWTVEWVCYDGQKRMINISEQRTVEEAFVAAFGKKTVRRLKRRVSMSGADKEWPRSQRQKVEETPNKDEGHTAEPMVSNGYTGKEPPTQPDAKEQSPSQVEQEEQKDEASSGPILHYYLSKPNTTSKVKCLIPVKAGSTLQEMLRSKTLLEFPTLYARQEPLDALPPPFVTEDDYNMKYGTDVGPPPPIFTPKEELEDGEINDIAKIDEEKVLEVLQQDLNS